MELQDLLRDMGLVDAFRIDLLAGDPENQDPDPCHESCKSGCSGGCSGSCKPGNA